MTRQLHISTVLWRTKNYTDTISHSSNNQYTILYTILHRSNIQYMWAYDKCLRWLCDIQLMGIL